MLLEWTIDIYLYIYPVELLISVLQRTVDIVVPLGIPGCGFILKPDSTDGLMRRRKRTLALKSFRGSQINIKFLLMQGENYVYQDRHIYLFVFYYLSEKGI